jgi:uncharacterized SAM-binding protein YcdF (DUF218 family)
VLLKDLLVALILPPFGFLSLAVPGLLLLHLRPRIARGLLWLAVLGLLAFAMPAVSETLLVALESGLDTTPPATDPPQAIVILGAESIRTGGPSPGNQVGRLTLERLRAGAELQRRTGLPVLVTGGTTQEHEPPVGALMARSMQDDFRVPVRWTETESRDTWENAVDSAAILHAAGIHSVYVVTHSWHMRRALDAFARTDLVATPAPTSLDRSTPPGWHDFLPRVSAWQSGYYAMHEWVGRAWYALR